MAGSNVVVLGAVVAAVTLWLWHRSNQDGSVAAAVRGLVERYYPSQSPSLVTLQRRTLRRMMETVSVGVSGQPLLPTSFEVSLAGDDSMRIADVQAWFTEGLVEAFEVACRERNWVLGGTPAVSVVCVDTAVAGAPLVRASFSPLTELDQRIHGVPPQAVRQTEVDEAVELVGAAGVWRVASGMTIGRDAAASVTLSDPVVSRQHARIETDASSPTGLSIVDLDSLNGISIDGDRISRAPLVEGLLLQFGPTIRLKVTTHTAGKQPVPSHTL